MPATEETGDVWLERDGWIRFEAERLSHHAWWAEKTEPAGFTGASYLRWEGPPPPPPHGPHDQTGRRMQSSDTHLVVRVFVTRAGLYRFDWVNHHERVDGDNDAWLGEWEQAASVDWPIVRAGDSLRDGPGFSWLDWGVRAFMLRPGLNTLFIGGRSRGFGVDRIALWRDGDEAAKRAARDRFGEDSPRLPEERLPAVDAWVVEAGALPYAEAGWERFGRSSTGLVGLPEYIAVGERRNIAIPLPKEPGTYRGWLVYLTAREGQPCYRLRIGEDVLLDLTGRTTGVGEIVGEPIPPFTITGAQTARLEVEADIAEGRRGFGRWRTMIFERVTETSGTGEGYP